MGSPKNETKTEVAKTEAAAPTPEELAAKAATERAEKLFNVLTSMNDADDSQWEPNRMPKLSYLSSVIGGEPVTMEEVGSVVEEISDIQRRLVSPEDNDEDSTPEMKEAARLQTLAKTKPVIQMDKTVLTPEVVNSSRARLAELEADITAKAAVARDATEAKQTLQKERDIIVARLATLESNSHSETVKAYQASEHRANEQRAADLATFRRATGGLIPNVGATNADTNRMQRRALRRRLGA
jgi:hypothetical protein